MALPAATQVTLRAPRASSSFFFASSCLLASPSPSSYVPRASFPVPGGVRGRPTSVIIQLISPGFPRRELRGTAGGRGQKKMNEIRLIRDVSSQPSGVNDLLRSVSFLGGKKRPKNASCPTLNVRGSTRCGLFLFSSLMSRLVTRNFY